ncbi:non-ribosomal peptide synthetase [Virgisporangium aurantiacum]|uniref:non-ribosomal peptide synthetase n=1 Tax=Virgisporangium aurantiacum TaxID=175570 RepID=UPI00194FCA8E|nr:non-ribosomal peptide synthetase [Virgisporangium aurantiacum]
MTAQGTEPVHKHIAAHAVARPDHPAVIDATSGIRHEISYGQLHDRARHLAYQMREQMCESRHAEPIVAVELPRGVDLVVALLAVWYAGAAYLPLDPDYPPERLSTMITSAQPDLHLTPATLAHLTVPQAADDSWVPARPRQEQIAYLIYTSGSTGTPKGVVGTHGALSGFARAQQDLFRATPEDRILQLLSISFDVALSEILMALTAGATLVVSNAMREQSATELVDLLHRERVTIAQIPPSLLGVLPPADLPSLHTLVTGGEAFPRDLIARWALGRRFFNAYGPTETTISATTARCLPEDVRPVSIGRPLSNAAVYVLDVGLGLTPIGVPGEVYIGGGGVARGYLGRPELTAAAFVADPYTADGRRMYRTGDRARWRADGQLEFLGRVDDQVKVAGLRIELGEIEAVLAGHDGVAQAAAALQPDGDQQRIVAYLVPATATDPPGVDELRRFLERRLPAQMLPAMYVWLDRLPVTPNGKVDRSALPPPDRSRARLAETYVAPSTPVEEALAGIWAEVLNVDLVGVRDNFFELGGDSIKSLQMITRARAVGLDVTARLLFAEQTIAGLATTVAEMPATEPGEQDALTGPVPLTPIQHWFLARDLPEPDHFNQAVLLSAPADVDVALLSTAWQALIDHHDALRLRLSRHPDRGWIQSYSDDRGGIEVDTTDVPTGSDLGAALSLVGERAHSGMDLEHGPLLRLGLVRDRDRRCVRHLVAIHHFAVDAVSWQFLIEDLATAYRQLEAGQPIRLPAKTSSYQEWARYLVEYARGPELLREAAYWLDSMPRRPRALPVDNPAGSNTWATEARVTVTLDPESTSQLTGPVHRTYSTQMNDLLLTALARTLADWTGQTDVLVDLEGHGREVGEGSPDPARTVGWFTSLFPVSLRVQPAAPLADSLVDVKEQLRRLPRRGLPYGVARWLGPSELADELAARPMAECSFNYVGQLGPAGAVAAEPPPFSVVPGPTGPVHGTRGPRPYTLTFDAAVQGGRFHLTIGYSTDVHAVSTVSALADRYLATLRALITLCLDTGTPQATPSDFPLAGLDQAQLNALLARMTRGGGQT